MDWNFKPHPGYLSELDQGSIPNISPIDGSISFGSSSSFSKGEFSFDLKLGQVDQNSNSRSSMNRLKEAAGAKSNSSSVSGSMKRARASGNGNLTVFCLVDDCNSDLSNCREYHRRHKVCEVHSKTPVVTIHGQKQRFCQQCSRFHSLEEFDEGKRSCRKRLDGHNRRRRKPQPEPISRPPSFLSNFQGNKLLQFSSSHAFPSTTVVSTSWAHSLSYNQHHQRLQSSAKQQQTIFPISSPSSSSSSYKVEKQLAFLQDQNPNGQTFSRHNNYSLSGGDSDCALSLLSSPSQTQSGHHVVVQLGSVPMVQQLPLGSEPDNVVGYGSGLFHSTMSVSDGSLVSGNETAPQTFPFYWE